MNRSIEKNLPLFNAKRSLIHGGEYRKKRAGRGARPLSTKHAMHLVIRSSKAVGTQSFLKPENAKRIKALLTKMSKKYGVKILSLGNAGNHIHYVIKLSKRQTYTPFIRGITGGIAQIVTKASRFKKRTEKFWDLRPYTRIAEGRRNVLTLMDYVFINKLEGLGISRERAYRLMRKQMPLRKAPA